MNNDMTGRNGRGDALMRALRRLPQDIAPRRDLWGGIEAALTATPGEARSETVRPTRLARLSWPYALAAGVGCMALGALLTFGVLRDRAPVANGDATLAASAQDVRFTDASFGGYEALGPEYEQARAQLAIGLAQRLDRLPPDAQRKIERNLAEIRRSLREINVALALDPDSILLQQLLLSTYQSELTMLANVNQMAGSIPARSQT